jgi:Flavin containing amine oxidoreductase
VVAVVGAGFAGLCAAQQLLRGSEAGGEGVEVVLVEATAHVGGRCRQDGTGFVPWKALELGAEFIHGKESLVYKLCAEHGFPVLRLVSWAQGDGELPDHPVGGGVSAYYIGKEKRFVRPFHRDAYAGDSRNDGIRAANDAVWDLSELPAGDVAALAAGGGGGGSPNSPAEQKKPARRTLQDYFAGELGVPPGGLALLEAGYANTLCGSLSSMGLAETARLERAWEDTDGGGDFRMVNSFADVLRHLQRGVADLRTRWPVARIAVEETEKENGGRVVLTRGGDSEEQGAPPEELRVDRVIVTASLACMQQGTIEFVPPLPRAHEMALAKMVMAGASKITLLFRRRFWPADLHGMICSDTFVPEIYFDMPARPGSLTPESIAELDRHGHGHGGGGDDDEDDVVIVVAYACAAAYDRLAGLTRPQIRDGILAQCDEIFGGQDLSRMCSDPRKEAAAGLARGPPDVNSRTPASDAFVDMMVMDWGKQPFVRGGYCSPGPEVSELVRQTAAGPVGDNRVFFAGEHTNPDHYMSVHAAMESGIRAALDVQRSLHVPSSPLPVSKL